jgi:hypothetical protein
MMLPSKSTLGYSAARVASAIAREASRRAARLQVRVVLDGFVGQCAQLRIVELVDPVL